MKRDRSYKKSLKIAAISMISIFPMMIAIIGLIGLFKVFITKEMLTSIFTGNVVWDTLAGTFAGMIAVGQALISYIIGGELLDSGISMYAVGAFILAWVTLGLVKLPLEAEVLGWRFMLLRNILAFIFTIIIAVLAVWSAQWLK